MTADVPRPSPPPNELAWLGGLLGVHALLWTLVPSLLKLNLRVDVLEGLFWGREWQLGYYKHPPLAAWLLEGAVTLLGRHDVAVYLLAQLSLCVALTAVWLVAKDWLDDPRDRLLAVFLLELVPFHNVISIEFNPNTVMLPCWGLTILFGWRALSRGGLHNWALLGACSALALYGKYESGVLLACLAALSVVAPVYRRCWKTPGPYVALAAGTAVFLPHLRWLLSVQFLPLSYAVTRASDVAQAATGLVAHLLYPVRFVGEQAAVSLPFWAFYLVCRRRARSGAPGLAAPEATREGGRSFLTFVVFGPLALFFTLSLAAGWRVLFLWGVPLFLFLPLYCLVRWPLGAGRGGVGRWVSVAAVVFGVFPTAYSLATPYIERLEFPGRRLAHAVYAEWEARFPGKPLRYVVGAEKYQGWVPGNVAYYLPQRDRPSVSLEFSAIYTPWVTPEDLRREGGVVLWTAGNDTPPWAGRFAFSPADTPSELRLTERRKGKLKELAFHLVLVEGTGGKR